MPYSVTEDCAEAAPTAARAARAIRDFFIASFSKVKQRAPVDGSCEPDFAIQAAPDLQNPRLPGPTSSSEVGSIAPDLASFRKGKQRFICNLLPPNNMKKRFLSFTHHKPATHWSHPRSFVRKTSGNDPAIDGNLMYSNIFLRPVAQILCIPANHRMPPHPMPAGCAPAAAHRVLSSALWFVFSLS